MAPPIGAWGCNWRRLTPDVCQSASLTSFALLAGIKKAHVHRYRSTNGMDPKFLRNARHALHGTREAVRKERKVRGVYLSLSHPRLLAGTTLLLSLIAVW